MRAKRFSRDAGGEIGRAHGPEARTRARRSSREPRSAGMEGPASQAFAREQGRHVEGVRLLSSSALSENRRSRVKREGCSPERTRRNHPPTRPCPSRRWRTVWRKVARSSRTSPRSADPSARSLRHSSGGRSDGPWKLPHVRARGANSGPACFEEDGIQMSANFRAYRRGRRPASARVPCERVGAGPPDARRPAQKVRPHVGRLVPRTGLARCGERKIRQWEEIAVPQPPSPRKRGRLGEHPRASVH